MIVVWSTGNHRNATGSDGTDRNLGPATSTVWIVMLSVRFTTVRELWLVVATVPLRKPLTMIGAATVACSV
jgi:hypothetical protein